MATQFCAHCGAKLLSSASFCVECGERQSAASGPRASFSLPLQRYAPLFVVLMVVAVGGAAIFAGSLTPKTPPSVPGRGAPQAPAGAPGSLPEGHPPLGIPEQVKQVIHELAQKAAAAPDDLQTWKRLAEVQYRAGQVDPNYLAEAAASYQHVLEREPENLEVIRNLGNIAFDQDQHETAIGHYQDYLKRKPDDVNVQTDMGTMYLSAGKPEQAIATYEAVLKADPSFFQAQLNLAVAYRTLGQTDKMATALEKARALAPDDQTRAQVDQFLAHAKGEPPSGPGSGALAMPPAPAPPAAAAAAGGAAAGGAAASAAATFQADAEAVFRQSPVLGQKVQRLEWAGAETAKVYVRDFPVDQMPAEMLHMFEDRMKGRIKEKKEAHQVTQTARFELVDDATGKVLDSIIE
jgi:tetratricopeptide (TPR) repeat protein